MRGTDLSVFLKKECRGEYYFSLRMEEITGSWRKLRNEELHNLHFSLPRPEGKMPFGVRG
jgi:hypothetical protein